jgi:hypothetical protein
MQDAVQSRTEPETGLRQAIENDEFFLVYRCRDL